MGILLSILLYSSLSFSQIQKPIPISSSQRMDQLEAELKEIKKTLINYTSSSYQNKQGVLPFFAESLHLGGYFENSVNSIWGPNTESQTVADSHKLGFNLAADLGQRIRVISQYSVALNYSFRNPHNNPSHGSTILPTKRSYQEVVFGSILSQAFLEYESAEFFNIQVGMGYVPFGYAFQIREPVLFRRRLGPQMIRTNGVTDIIIANPFWKGIHISGHLDQFFGYHLYSVSPLSHSGKMGWGSRLWWKPLNWFILGASSQNAHRKNNQYFSYGTDLTLDFKYFGLIAEYSANESPLAQLASYYAQLFFRFFSQKLTLHLDGDYLKHPLGVTTLGTASVGDPYTKWEYGFGLNYQFLPNVKIRLGYLVHDYVDSTATIAGQNRDYQSINTSMGLSF